MDSAANPHVPSEIAPDWIMETERSDVCICANPSSKIKLQTLTTESLLLPGEKTGQPPSHRGPSRCLTHTSLCQPALGTVGVPRVEAPVRPQELQGLAAATDSEGRDREAGSVAGAGGSGHTQAAAPGRGGGEPSGGAGRGTVHAPGQWWPGQSWARDAPGRRGVGTQSRLDPEMGPC